MTSFVTYDTATGSIRQFGTCSDELYSEMPPPPEAGTAAIGVPGNTNPGAWIAARYVAAGVVVLRQTMTAIADKTTITANGSDAATISGLPVPCRVTVSGALSIGPETVSDGTLELTSDHPGDLLVNVTAEPAWLPWSITIHAS